MCCPAHSACHSDAISVHKSNIAGPILSIVAKVSVVALAVLSIITDRALFYPYFAVGLMIGAYIRCSSDGSGDRVMRTENIAFSGLIENITGVRLPPLLCLGINVSSYVCHIDHHPGLFIPATGLAVGAWIGDCAVGLLAELGCKA